MVKKRANRQGSPQARGTVVSESVSGSFESETEHVGSASTHSRIGKNVAREQLNTPTMSGCDGAGDDHVTMTKVNNTIATAVSTAMQGAMQTLNDTMLQMAQQFTTQRQPQRMSRQISSRSSSASHSTSTSHRNCQRDQRSPSKSSSDSDKEVASNSTVSSPVRRYPRRTSNAKLPVFTGKEPWKVWYNRFNEVAERRRWNNEDKLDELLPLLQGAAGEFVYGQLSHHTRSKYDLLTAELASRYRVVETTRTFAAQFSRRNQTYHESVEEYAADLKHLYAKAFKDRDAETREQDLLRRFLDVWCAIWRRQPLPCIQRMPQKLFPHVMKPVHSCEKWC
jgi:hypothetical protein